MARIAGVNVPDKKRIPIALTYIHGIGTTTAFKICEKLNIDVQTRMGQISEDDLGRIRAEIDSDAYKIEGDLRREVSMNIKRLMDMKCYRGLRCVTVWACLYAVSAQAQTHVPVKAQQKQLLAKRNRRV